MAAFTFVPTFLALKLTSTITLSATQTAFNSISVWKGAASLANLTGAVAGTAVTTAPIMVVADANTVALATPSYKISVAYPVATVKGASSLAMSLAAATVLATLF